MNGGCVVAQMHDQRRRAAPHTTALAAAAVLGECDERVGGRLLPLGDAACLLVGGALLLGDVPDRLLEDAPCSSGNRPLRHSSRRPRVHDMLNARRAYSAWSSATTGGASVRAASPIALGGLPTATRASSASLSGVANSAAAAT